MPATRGRFPRGIDYSQRAQLVAQLAPPAPPCFSSRDQWLTFLAAACVAGVDGTANEPDLAPLVFVRGEPAAFNPRFAFCADCTPEHRRRMFLEGRCHPDALRVHERRQEQEAERIRQLVDQHLAAQELQELAE